MKEIKRASDLIPDNRNANKGSVRGTAAISESLARYGAGRSVLADRNGKLIAGNGTTEGFVANGNDDVIVVTTDGTKLVVVQRTDLDLDRDTAARELAHADNRTNQLGYTPDVSIITEDMTSGLDLGWLWRNDELESMKGLVETPADQIIDYDKVPRGTGHEIVVVLNSEEEMREARRRIQELGYYTK
jgi:hypothetical protein